MTIGRAPAQVELVRPPASSLCDGKLSPTSVYRLLHDSCHQLFPDDAFADLFSAVGRESVPPRIVAVVMVLQKMEGLSDREAVDRFTYDLRWKYAAGSLDLDYPSFVHTVLVDMRARLQRSAAPDRIFTAILKVAKDAGLVGRRRVLDSTALYDAVSTQDTVTMIRSGIRGLLRVAPEPLVGELRGALERDDTYATPGKPTCDWDDKAAREELVDALARDALAVLYLLDGRELAPDVHAAATLLATVVGQDLEGTEDHRIRIARRVAPDRVISTVDPEARHGHKTAARGFDGYKGNLAIDPDSEIITATAVTAGNAGDASAAEELLRDVLTPVDAASEANDAQATTGTRVAVYGDASYGTADLVERLEGADIEANVKVQPPSAREGMFSLDAFKIDLAAGTACCPNGLLVQLRTRKDGSQHAAFGAPCEACPLRSKCTTSDAGRAINLHPKHETLTRARTRQRAPEFKQDYRATRPKIERKIAHLMRRRHGGRRARMRGRERVAHDFMMLAAATNLARLAQLSIRPSTVPATSVNI